MSASKKSHIPWRRSRGKVKRKCWRPGDGRRCHGIEQDGWLKCACVICMEGKYTQLDAWKVLVCMLWMSRWRKGVCTWVGEWVKSKCMQMWTHFVPQQPFAVASANLFSKLLWCPQILKGWWLQLLRCLRAKALLGNQATDGSKSFFMLSPPATVAILKKFSCQAMESSYSSKKPSLFPLYHFTIILAPVPLMLCGEKGSYVLLFSDFIQSSINLEYTTFLMNSSWDQQESPCSFYYCKLQGKCFCPGHWKWGLFTFAFTCISWHLDCLKLMPSFRT